jgi:hypothetical protein
MRHRRFSPFAVIGVIAIVALLACGDDDARPGGGSSCPGEPSQGCETAVASRAECPRLEDVCAGVCGASYDCCFCDGEGWRTLFLDCAPCPDARQTALASDPDDSGDASRAAHARLAVP